MVVEICGDFIFGFGGDAVYGVWFAVVVFGVCGGSGGSAGGGGKVILVVTVVVW